MSRFRKPHGSYIRGTADWFSDELSWGGANVTAVSAQYSNVILFNDTTDGAYIHVMSIVYWANNATCNIGIGYIQPLPANQTKATAQALNPSSGLKAGTVYQSNTGSKLATENFCLGGGSTPQVLSPNHPVAILPSGYGLLLQSEIVNIQIAIGVYWLLLPQG